MIDEGPKPASPLPWQGGPGAAEYYEHLYEDCRGYCVKLIAERDELRERVLELHKTTEHEIGKAYKLALAVGKLADECDELRASCTKRGEWMTEAAALEDQLRSEARDALQKSAELRVKETAEWAAVCRERNEAHATVERVRALRDEWQRAGETSKIDHLTARDLTEALDGPKP